MNEINLIVSQEETATVISTMLLVTGLTTILHSFFGTRLPLVQGSSFVYLAPALVIVNSEEFRNLSENVSLQFSPYVFMDMHWSKIVLDFFQVMVVMLVIYDPCCYSGHIPVFTM